MSLADMSPDIKTPLVQSADIPGIMAAIHLQASRHRPSRRQFDVLPHWIIVLPVSATTRVWAAVPYGDVLQIRLARCPGATAGTLLATDLPGRGQVRAALVQLKPDINSFDLLTQARKLVAAHADLQPRKIGLLVLGFRPRAAERVAEALLAALYAYAAPMPDLRSTPRARYVLTAIHIYGTAPSHQFRRTRAELAGNSVARHLATLPPTVLTPMQYREQLEALATTHGLRFEFYGEDWLRARGAGAFLAVSQGSPVADAGIARLRYDPPRAKPQQRPVALVGKGICFDTGGINVKPASFMQGMQADMQGSAVALGTLLALAQLKVPFRVEAWLALAMNHVGPKAYKPTDVVTASNGITIEIVHTDAEGRMVLADTLALCSRLAKPRLIIDYATLTGACKRAVGNAYSGAFANRPAWVPMLIEAGRDSGERIWPFPLDADFDAALDSTIADVKQCAEDAPTDHIHAARFLQRFVGMQIPWLHLDLSAAGNPLGLAHVPTRFNGFGVRLSLHLLLDCKFLV